MSNQIKADAEQAKSTGGMIALLPSPASAELLYIEGGEPLADLHVTLAYLGEDVSGLGSSLSAQRLVEDIAEWTPILECRAFAHATFNPDGHNGTDPCGVYIIGDSADLPRIAAEVQSEMAARYEIPTQHSPWLAHVTAGYGLTAADLSYTGEVIFDRLTLEWAGDSHTIELGTLGR